MVLPLLDHLHVALNIQAGRAGQSAGRLVGLLNGECAGNRLGIFLEGRLSLGKALVIFARQVDGTDCGAIPAGRTFQRIDVSGGLVQGDGEGTLLTRNIHDFSAGDQIDIQMPADLDQLRRDNSHGAVIGGKCLVEFAHHTADGGRLLDQMDKISGIREIQRRLHPRDPTAYNHDGTYYILGHLILLKAICQKSDLLRSPQLPQRTLLRSAENCQPKYGSATG
ncbi:hypothetical protein TRIP_B200495 [uncultured Desulfatiglans sp.]|nr:hypothetical protein TRIP_B200495 [uncultured Desulfatiglans sp.]